MTKSISCLCVSFRGTSPCLNMASTAAPLSGVSAVPPIHSDTGVYSSSHEYGEMRTREPPGLRSLGTSFKNLRGFGRRQSKLEARITSNLPIKRNTLRKDKGRNVKHNRSKFTAYRGWEKGCMHLPVETQLWIGQWIDPGPSHMF